MKTSDKNKIKKNIIQELNHCLINNGNTLFYNGTNTYARGYVTLVSVNNQIDKKDFTLFYARLLKIKSFPILPIDTVLSLANTYKKNPDLYKHIKHFASLTSLYNLPLNTWEDVVTSLSSLNKPNYIHHKIKILTKIIISNIETIGKYNLLEFCKGIFSLSNDYNSVEVMVHGVRMQTRNKNKESALFISEDDAINKFGLFIYWADKIIKQGNNVHGNLKYLLNPQFCPSKQWLQWSPEIKEFLDFIEAKLPDNYLMRRHSQAEIEKLSNLFHMRKEMFLSSQVPTEELVHSGFILEPFFKKFIIPKIFFRDFFLLNDVQNHLLKHILEGNSIRKFEYLRLKMDKKACHFLRNQIINDNLPFWSHFALARLESEGMNRSYALKVCEAIRRSGGNYDFWIENMVMLYHKGLSERLIENVSDFILSKVLLEGGTIDFKRIAIKTLIERSNAWHDEVRLKKIANRKLPVSEINGFEFYRENGGDNYVIKQLTSSLELFKEGKELHHCVYSYTQACLMERSYIFSLRLREEFAELPLITIEISKNRIVQAKGSYNRPANKKEKEIIKMWAEKENLDYRIAA